MAIVTMTRSEANARLAHIPEGQKYLNILLSLGLIHIQPELSLERQALCAIMTETEVRQGEDYGKLTCGYISEYGSGCIIDGLDDKGYKIVRK